ncbi:MAG: hypothetical protein HOP21_04360 [Methylotenera sp.]|nr:hypothetical protein [Methylotenera sp.]
MRSTLKYISMLMMLVVSLNSPILMAETVVDYLTDVDGQYVGPTVEENVTLMDTDKNGFADASEVRVFLEKTHGKGFERALLDKFESSVTGSSCGSPFSNRLYVSN